MTNWMRGKASMDLILDTHVFLWFFLNDPRMGEAQRQVLRSETNKLHLSSVSVFEMATKARIGKLPRSVEIDGLLDTIYEDYAYTELPVRASHSAIAGRLGGPHPDPIDRLQAAQSRVEGIPLMTGDPVFRAFGVEVVW